jgi:predicted nuclease with TOPRIM domain
MDSNTNIYEYVNRLDKKHLRNELLKYMITCKDMMMYRDYELNIYNKKIKNLEEEITKLKEGIDELHNDPNRIHIFDEWKKLLEDIKSRGSASFDLFKYLAEQIDISSSLIDKSK